MARIRIAWWSRYGPDRSERAAKLLKQYERSIHSEITWHEREYGHGCDWEPAIWQAAYYAAWRSEKAFLPLFRRAVHWETRKLLSTMMRRNSKLRQHRLPESDDEIGHPFIWHDKTFN